MFLVEFGGQSSALSCREINQSCWIVLTSWQCCHVKALLTELFGLQIICWGSILRFFLHSNCCAVRAMTELEFLSFSAPFPLKFQTIPPPSPESWKNFQNSDLQPKSLTRFTGSRLTLTKNLSGLKKGRRVSSKVLAFEETSQLPKNLKGFLLKDSLHCLEKFGLFRSS